MFFSETQHVLDLLVTDWSLEFIHLPGVCDVRIHPLQKLHRPVIVGDAVVRGIEDLVPEPRNLDATMTHLAQIPGVGVRPAMRSPLVRLVDVPIEHVAAVVLIRLEHPADPQAVNVDTKPCSEASCDSLTAEFGERVGVCRVRIEVFRDGERGVLDAPLPECHTVRRDTARDDDFLDAHLACSLDDVVHAQDIAFERLSIRMDHRGGNPGEVNHRIGYAWWVRWEGFAEAHIRVQTTEYLPAVGDIAFDRVDFKVGWPCDVQVENLVSVAQQLSHNMAPNFAASSRENNALAAHCASASVGRYRPGMQSRSRF